jgi:uncharacterized repeat protein (TIGR01451 family)
MAIGPPPAVVAPAIPPVSGNLQAAPVYPDVPTAPLAPAPATSSFSNPLTPTIIGPPVAVGAPVALPGASPAIAPGPPVNIVPIGQDHLRITPDRVMAPVGTEVVLKAGICGADGYLHVDRRIEWQLSRDGAGQFTDIGDRGDVDIFRWPWDTPRKVDNWYAVGSTAYAQQCLHRGTPDPNDDVPIQRGEAWISVASATEGASHVTAFAPDVGNWQFRQAAAIIYWIDAQWAFPPSTVAPTGQPHVLTTTVTRRTDGAPLAGWTVRYDVSGGGASLGYAGGNFVDVPTDAAGRASVEVSPTATGSGASTVGITIVRPAVIGPGAAPSLEVGRGSATIVWGAPASPAPATAPPSLQPTPISPISPPPAPAADSGSTAPYRSPRDQATGPPQLVLQMRNVGPQEVAVGGLVSFELTVTNRGESTARNILVHDRFGTGLKHEKDTLNEHAIKYEAMPELPPGQSDTVALTFQVVAPGRHCHDVTVTADGAAPATEQGCVTGRASAFTVTIRGPVRRTVGEMAEFDITVQNTGDVPATNVAIVQQFHAALRGMATAPEHQLQADGNLRITVGNMAINERRTFRTQAQCVAAGDSACSRANVLADGGEPQASETCLQIVAPMP